MLFACVSRYQFLGYVIGYEFHFFRQWMLFAYNCPCGTGKIILDNNLGRSQSEHIPKHKSYSRIN